ncbi:hypothetical protein TNCV_3426611 [Trichonephila clavipes]|nr:hypothetical protein TNCV_3426611 [Trichonephila clavipes]
MNPIEQVLDILGREVAGRLPPTQTLLELERARLEEWDRIPIFPLIDSPIPYLKGDQRCWRSRETILSIKEDFL